MCETCDRFDCKYRKHKVNAVVYGIEEHQVLISYYGYKLILWRSCCPEHISIGDELYFNEILDTVQLPD